ncbi:hypothetical protein DV737_g4280, partial [Chaetothyriales sp. CBS 132003]
MVMTSDFAPSLRAQATLRQGPAWDLMQKVKKQPRYDPINQPKGIVNLSGALNNLMGDWLRESTEGDLAFDSQVLAYGPLSSSESLLEAAAGFFNHFFSPATPVAKDQVSASNGVTSLMNTLAWTLCDEGDSIMYTTPNYYMLDFNLRVRNGIRTVPVSLMDMVDAMAPNALLAALDQALERNRDVRCRVLFICNPTNPQGRYYPRATLQALSSWCAKRGMYLVADEIYGLSTFGVAGEDIIAGYQAHRASSFCSLLSIASRKHHHSIYSLSKDFNMGGARVAFLVSRNAQVHAAVAKLSWFTWLPQMSDTFVTAFLSRLDRVHDYLDTYRPRLAAAYERVCEELKRHRIPFRPAEGGLFVFVNLGAWIRYFGQRGRPEDNVTKEDGRVLSPELRLCEWLIEHGVFLNAGEAEQHCNAVVDLSDADSDAGWSAVMSHRDRDLTGEQQGFPTGEENHHRGEGDDEEICIFAQVLIPGRGDILRFAAVGVSVKTGSLTYVGPQSQLPSSLASVERLNVNYLMPGLWDCHTHFTGVINVDFPDLIQTHPATMGAAITRSLHSTLMAGITSVRDVGSFATEVAPLVERGLLLGPSVFGAGAAIGITGGSCDACTLPAEYVYSREGASDSSTNAWAGVSCLALADGVDKCRLAVRQQIRRGARCIKVVATGGVLSTQDNPEYRQYSDEELAALVGEARLQNRAVAVHAHGKEGIIAAVRAGAHTIEHGSYIDDEAAELMKKHGVSLVATRHVIEAGLRNLERLNPPTAAKMVAIAKQHMEAYRTAVRHGVKIALGTDIAGSDPRFDTAPGRNGDEVYYAVKAGLTPLQAIEAGTINSAETLGKLAPKKGLLRAGWDADMIALDENPLESPGILGRPEDIKYVWKGGLLVKSPARQLMWPPLKSFR